VCTSSLQFPNFPLVSLPGEVQISPLIFTAALFCAPKCACLFLGLLSTASGFCFASSFFRSGPQVALGAAGIWFAASGRPKAWWSPCAPGAQKRASGFIYDRAPSAQELPSSRRSRSVPLLVVGSHPGFCHFSCLRSVPLSSGWFFCRLSSYVSFPACIFPQVLSRMVGTSRSDLGSFSRASAPANLRIDRHRWSIRDSQSQSVSRMGAFSASSKHAHHVLWYSRLSLNFSGC
jgi:hypothetical protein